MAIFTSLVYAAIIIAVALTTNSVVFYALCGLPLIFVLSYFLGFAMKLWMIKFIVPKSAYNAYDNAVDNYFRSEFNKETGSIF